MKCSLTYLHLRVTTAERIRLRSLASVLGRRGSVAQLLRYLSGFDSYPEHLLEQLKSQLPSRSDPDDHRTEYVYVQITREERQQLYEDQTRDAAQTYHPKPLSHHLRVRAGLAPTSAWAQAAGYAASRRGNRPVLTPDDIGLYMAALSKPPHPVGAP